MPEPHDSAPNKLTEELLARIYRPNKPCNAKSKVPIRRRFLRGKDHINGSDRANGISKKGRAAE